MCGIFCLIQEGKVGHNLVDKCLDTLVPRGPDRKNIHYLPHNNKQICLGFTRLAIMDTTDAGLQPFHHQDTSVVCNGEIYNYKQLAHDHGITMKSSCDCEVVLPLYEKVGFGKMVMHELDAEFAMVIYDKKKDKLFVARDRYGVRPLFYGWNKTTRSIGFASEMKALHPIMEFVEPVKPNQIIEIDLSSHPSPLWERIVMEDYFDYNSLTKKYYQPGCHPNDIVKDDLGFIYDGIRKIFTEAVKKRLHSDRKLAFLLSGGLDSSLVVSIASRILGAENMVCFSIGLDDSPDVVAAKQVAEFLGIKQHHIVSFTVDGAINAVEDVVRVIESYDVTSIRASTMQFLLAKYIREKTDIKVLLSGEGSDELHGSYRYFRDAPNVKEFHQETLRLVEELYMYDNLRTDRTLASNGLEARIPFLDREYVDFIKSVDPRFLMYNSSPENVYPWWGKKWMEKQIVRDSFRGYLPDEILYRSKEAFSDAVNTADKNWFRILQSRLDKEIDDEELINNEFKINKPETKESLYYRRIFNQIYPGRDNVIAHYWMPKWQKEKVVDPSATVLKCY